MVNFALYLTYILFFVAIGAAIVMPIINSINDPKSLMKAGIGIGALVLLFLISWAISGSEVTAVYQKFDVSESGSKFVGGGLITMYLLVFIAIIGIIYTEISKLIK